MEIDSAVVPVVQVSNLDFRFDSALPLVLKDVTMSIARGRSNHDIFAKSLLPSVCMHSASEAEVYNFQRKSREREIERNLPRVAASIHLAQSQEKKFRGTMLTHAQKRTCFHTQNMT